MIEIEITDSVLEKFRYLRRLRVLIRTYRDKDEYSAKINEIMDITIEFDRSKTLPQTTDNKLFIENSITNLDNNEVFAVYDNIYFGTSKELPNGNISVNARLKWMKRLNSWLAKQYKNCYAWLLDISKNGFMVKTSFGTINNGILLKGEN